MSEETKASITHDESASSKEVKKRATYPVKDLKSIIDFAGKIYSHLGHTEYHSNKAIAAVHGLAPESIKQHLSSGQQYKVLEIKHGVGYKTSEHFKKLFLPKNDSEKREAVIESLKSPEVYQQLFKDYEFHIVPPEGVRNHFIRAFGFKEDTAAKAAQVFVDNLKDFNLLDTRGVLISGLPIQQNNKLIDSVEDTVTEAKVPETQPQSDLTNKHEDDLFELPIPLPGKRRAFLRYPVDTISRKDIKVITKALEFIASSLEDEEEV